MMGGGYSADKHLRTPGESWWPEEMPSNAEYQNASENLKSCGYEVDFMLSHTASSNTVEYLSGLESDIMNAIAEERPINEYLQWVEANAHYKKWYFGHFHKDRVLWKNQYALFNGIREFKTGKLAFIR